MRKTKNIMYILIFCLILFWATNVYAVKNENLKNATRAYLNAEITYSYGTGDCILLENYDENGNKIYGLIDAGRKIAKKDENANSSTAVKKFLIDHGVQKLEFFAITHSHSDHNGDALTVLDNFDVDTIYMKEFDVKWSIGGTQATYENIIERAIEKNIKIVGVSYESLISSEISPSRSKDFIKSTENAKPELFESFYYRSDTDTNAIFKFGSANIEIFNWEIFDEEGNLYTIGKTKESVNNENNNSMAFLLIQGNKKAFFSGDMNNLDANEENGRLGDEDRLKDAIGKVDFLKIGHHGYKFSNTEDYLNVLKPKYALITNDIGGAYKNTIDWLEENNVEYLYTTQDIYGVSATITENDVYLGFETTGTYKKINGKLYYVPEGQEYQYTDYKDVLYEVKYEEKQIEVNSFIKLKEEIEKNKNQTIDIDNNNKICTIYKLKVNLKSGGDWTANSSINIEMQQNISLTTSNDITILRGTELKKNPIFEVNGELSLGISNMSGKITIDGNKHNVEATSVLIRLDDAKLDIFKNTTLCNNMNKSIGRTLGGSTNDYTSFGSAIYAKTSVINMYGGEIKNNSQDVEVNFTLPENMYNNYRFSTFGTGIYMTNVSVLNMYGGKINDNEAQNHSIVRTADSYTNTELERTLAQRCDGVGIYANADSEVNLLGGEIVGNSAKNYAQTTLSTSTIDNKETNLYEIKEGIYGVGIYLDTAKTTISNDFIISENKAEVDTKILIQNDTVVKNSVNSDIRGTQCYILGSNVKIDGAIISNSINSNNTEELNNGSIGKEKKGKISTTNYGGAIYITSNTVFDIEKLTVENCSSGYGGGIFIYASKGTISNSKISGNEAQYGGGIYITGESSDTVLNNIEITNNKTTGSGGGVYAYGNLRISGKNTTISNNTAETYGGGIMVKNNAIINDGNISENSAQKNQGGGVRVDGMLTINGGTIEKNSTQVSSGGGISVAGTLEINGGIIQNNTAATTGGGIDWLKGTLNLNKGIVKNNTAAKEGNEIYPIIEEKLTSTQYTVDEEQKILTDVELETTVDIFKTKISGVTNYTIKDKNGK
ncbi:MAG: hypothetical protein IJV31_07320, partial [Clostridia bacterium]|nr:hypothetical protein [Clostridia bacterium]